jgi:hypothetical protein
VAFGHAPDGFGKRDDYSMSGDAGAFGFLDLGFFTGLPSASTSRIRGWLRKGWRPNATSFSDLLRHLLFAGGEARLLGGEDFHLLQQRIEPLQGDLQVRQLFDVRRQRLPPQLQPHLNLGIRLTSHVLFLSDEPSGSRFDAFMAPNP